MTARTARLPGIRFELQPPPPARALPRMDIAAFVGFAASGPLHVPVPVEDAAQFEAVFGGVLPGESAPDLALAWDEQRGAAHNAYLAPAVRAFFRGGGRRCYVIRVAGPASTNVFPIPGLLHVAEDGSLSPASARARSEGSWSDDLRCGCEMISLPMALLDLCPPDEFRESFEADLALNSPQDLQSGDLLRLNVRLGEARFQLLFVPDTIQVLPQVGGTYTARVAWKTGRWLELPGAPRTMQDGQARIFHSSNPELRRDPLSDTTPGRSTAPGGRRASRWNWGWTCAPSKRPNRAACCKSPLTASGCG